MSKLPPSILGESSVESDFDMTNGTAIQIFRLQNRHGRLIKITFNEISAKLNVDNFFYAVPFDALQDASEKAASQSRTLAGLGMEWVLDVANHVEAKTITLHDGWNNRNKTLTSKNLQTQAALALDPDDNPILRRAERVVKPDGSDTKQEYLHRVKKGGFYGQFGFEYVEGNEMKLEVSRYKGLNASFADLCLNNIRHL